MTWSTLSDRWKGYFVSQLNLAKSMSKDENTKVGCLIIDTESKIVLSSGWNDLPRGVQHKGGRNERPLKYLYTSHAERSCLDNALRSGVDVVGKTMLVSLACCPQCACSVVNCGIGELITPPIDYGHHSCGDLYLHTEQIISEGGVLWGFDGGLK